MADITLIDSGTPTATATTPEFVGQGYLDTATDERYEAVATTGPGSFVLILSQAELDAAVAGLYDHKGGYDASTNTPDLDTTPSGIKKGDAYTASVAGTFYAVSLEAGDVLIADQDNPTASAHWTIVNRNIDSSAFATSAQGDTADTATQPGDNISTLINDSGFTDDQTKADIDALNIDADTVDGSHASTFATSAQGSTADTATQPGDNISTLVNDSGFTDDQTKTEIDALNVDADTVDGSHASAFATSAEGSAATSAVQPGDNISTLTNNLGFTDDQTKADIDALNIDAGTANEQTIIRQDGVYVEPTSFTKAVVWKFTRESELNNPPGTGSWRHTATIQGWTQHSSSYPSYQLSFGNGAFGIRQSVSNTAWGSWRTVVESNGTYSGLTAGDADKLNGQVNSSSSTGSTVVSRNSSGDINTRLFRSEYDITNSNINFVMTQVNTASNNYLRPSTMAQLRNSLNVENGATVGIGVGQAWVDVTGSRTAGTTYTNSTGRAIEFAYGGRSSGTGGTFVMTINGVSVAAPGWGSSVASGIGASWIIPNGHTYKFTEGGYTNVRKVSELR